MPLNTFNRIEFGALPVDKINSALGTELEEGNAYLSSIAHEHIALDHPKDYPVIIPHLNSIISNPAYIGQDTKHADNFILIKRIPNNGPALVAIKLKRNKSGNYNIATAYLVNEKMIEQRRNFGTLFVAI